MAWLDAFLLWLIPLALINALTATWRWRISIRGEDYPHERAICWYLCTVINAGLACLIVGFATSPVHPSNSPFVPIGVFGMFLAIVGPLAAYAIQDFLTSTGEKWEKENREAERRRR